MKKKVLSILLAIVMILTIAPVSVFAEDNVTDYLNYTIRNGNVTITGYKESIPGELVIPDTIEDCPVTSIGSSAFNGCESLTSITIPVGVTEIESMAFADCTAIETVVVLADNLTTVESNAFKNDLNIRTVELHSVKFLRGNYEPLFQSAETLIIGEPVTEIPDEAFESSDVQYTSNGITVEDGIQLRNVILGDSVTKIGKEAFAFCEYLENVDMKNVTDIGKSAFAKCKALSTVNISDKITHIGAYAFDDTKALAYRDGGNYIQNYLISADNKAIEKIEHPKSDYTYYYVYEIADGTTCIEDGAFIVSVNKNDDLWKSLKPVNVFIVPDSVVSFGASASTYDNLVSSEGLIYYSGDKTQWDNIQITDGQRYTSSDSAWKKFEVVFNSTRADFDALTSANTYILGDVDGNGEVTPSDARIALRCSAGLDILEDNAFAAADIDTDGKVSTSEARSILRVAAGIDLPFNS